MLWTIAVTLIVLWLLGLAAGDALGYYIHIPFFIAIIAMLIQIDADCSAYNADHRRKRSLKRQSAGGSGNILSRLAAVSADKVLQPVISPPTYTKD